MTSVYWKLVLVSQGWFKQQGFISHNSGVWEVQHQGLVRCHFLVCRQLTSPCILMRRGAEREKANSLVSLLIWALIPFMRALPSKPNHLP